MRFDDLSLIPPLLQAISEEGYVEPTPIQERTIPFVLEGRDVLGIAQTGTGKTAAFSLPILQRLAAAGHPAAGTRRPIRALVITPTRELASQIGESLRTYGRHLPLRNTVIFGGVGQRPQVNALMDGVDVLVATPGRLLDLMSQRHVRFDRLEILVLDEADRMLDMGFLPDVRRILAALPKRRQTLFFSATMPREAKALADTILVDPAHVAVTPPATTVERVDQSVYFVEKGDKQALLHHLLRDPEIAKVLVFSRTKHGADRIAKRLRASGVDADAIHADRSQGQRERALEGFKEGVVRVLVATDIAARGIDVDEITHVVNFDLPNVPESYVHRIGRTARAGAAGCAIAFCDHAERAHLAAIEREIRMRLHVRTAEGFHRGMPPPPVPTPPSAHGRPGVARAPHAPAHATPGPHREPAHRDAAHREPPSREAVRREAARGTHSPGNSTRPTAAHGSTAPPVKPEAGAPGAGWVRVGERRPHGAARRSSGPRGRRR